jgi:hypothetical protein
MTMKSKRRLYRPTKQQHSEAPASPRGSRALPRQSQQLNPGLRLAVEAVGGRMAYLARLLDITPQAIAQWDKIPIKRVLDVERVTKVDREQLRPDFYRRRGSKQ